MSFKGRLMMPSTNDPFEVRQRAFHYLPMANEHAEGALMYLVIGMVFIVLQVHTRIFCLGTTEATGYHTWLLHGCDLGRRALYDCMFNHKKVCFSF